MPADVLEVTKKFMRNPVRILVKKEQLTLEGIKQFYVGVEKEVILSLCSVQLQAATVAIRFDKFFSYFFLRSGSWILSVIFTKL